MKHILTAILLPILLTSCAGKEQQPPGSLYSSQELTVYGDSIISDGTTFRLNTSSEDSVSKNLPRYSSDQPIIDALYSLAVKEIASYRNDRTLSYDTYLALASLRPESTFRQLKQCITVTENGPIIAQQAGTGGAWPVTNDRISFAQAAWELYKASGDISILGTSLPAIENTLNLNMLVSWDERHKLMRGEVPHPDRRTAIYPQWMTPIDVYQSMSLGGNTLFASAFAIRDSILRILPDAGIKPMWVGIDKEIAASLNTTVWIPRKGCYGQYLYGGFYPILSPANDNFAQALAIIYGIANREMAKSIISRTPYPPYGIPDVYPVPVENDGKDISGIVQSFWAVASAKARNIPAVEKGIAAMLRTGAIHGTSTGLFIPAMPVKHLPDRWSAPGMAAIIHRVIFGMDYQPDGISFNPIVPMSLSGEKKLSGLPYRNATLTIKIFGTGERIKTFSINGMVSQRHFLPDTVSGNVTVEITMDNRPPGQTRLNSQPFITTLPTPVVTWKDDSVAIVDNFNDSTGYSIYVNSYFIDNFESVRIPFTPLGGFSTVTITPFTKTGLSGFSSQPRQYIAPGSMTTIPSSLMSAAGTALIADHSLSRQFVEATTDYNTVLYFRIDARDDGDYLIDFCYANGEGPADNGDKCAVRMLYLEDAVAGAIVMPQLGAGNWTETAYSNMVPVKLKRGRNHLSLRLTVGNTNRKVNTTLIKYARIIRQ